VPGNLKNPHLTLIFLIAISYALRKSTFHFPVEGIIHKIVLLPVAFYIPQVYLRNALAAGVLPPTSTGSQLATLFQTSWLDFRKKLGIIDGMCQLTEQLMGII
jgi:ABC-type sulfate transport system permease component